MMRSRRKSQGELRRCRRALDQVVTEKEWSDIFKTMMNLAVEGDSESVRVRAAELLLRYRYGPPTEPPPEEEDIQPIRIIEICSSADRPADE